MTKACWKTVERLGDRHIRTVATMSEANELVRKLVYQDLVDSGWKRNTAETWIEVNKVIRDRRSRYIIIPVFVDEDDEDFDLYIHELDCVIVARRKGF